MASSLIPHQDKPSGGTTLFSVDGSRGADHSPVKSNINNLDHESVRFRPMTILAMGTIVALLFFAREVFIPLSLAVLLSFLLAIPCSFLERHGFKRTPAILLIMTLTFALITGTGWLVSVQFYDLAKKLPGYHEVIEAKLKSLKASPHGTVGKFNRILRQTAEELQAPDAKEPSEEVARRKPGETVNKSKPEPIQVEVHQPPLGSLEMLRGIVAPVLKPLATAFMVLVVLFFMLFSREDLRNRLIRLAGTDRMDLTTDALDEAGERVSRYLSLQLIVNCCFGLLIGVGIFFIGVPSPLLWGVLAMILRFIPYVGPWIAAAAPLVLAFAIEPGWAKLGWTGGLFVTVELATSNVIEPLLYGSSTGVSPVALLLAAIFWTWLWGPVGLLLSTPLTVCFAVIGLHIPQMRFLHIVLGDEPVLTPETRFYQRMLAMDREEADGIVEDLLKEKPLIVAYEELMIPALTYAKEDLTRGRLSKEKEDFLFENIASLVEELAEDEKAKTEKDTEGPILRILGTEAVVAIIPAKDRADEIAGAMLNEILARRKVPVRAFSAAVLTAECMEELSSQVRVVCISAVPPTGLRRARYLCKKLRSRFPQMKLVIGLWGATESLATARETLATSKPDLIVSSFGEAIAAIISFGCAASQPVVQLG